MKNTAGYAVLFALSLALFGCADKTLSYRMVGREYYQPDCYTLSGGEGCASMSFLYPQFSSVDTVSAARANRWVSDMLFAPQGQAEALSASFFAHWETFRNESLEQDSSAEHDDDDDTHEHVLLPWHYAASIEPQGCYRGMLSFAYTVSTDALYLKPSREDDRKYFVLDRKSGRLLSVCDVFTDTLAVRRLVTAVFLEAAGVVPGMSLTEQGVLPGTDGLLPSTDDFAIDSHGNAVFRYDMQALAPTVRSEDEITVPLALLEPLFNPRL